MKDENTSDDGIKEGMTMDLTTCLEHYAEQRVPKNKVKKVSHIIFAYILLSAGLSFNLYTFFY